MIYQSLDDLATIPILEIDNKRGAVGDAEFNGTLWRRLLYRKGR